MDCRSPLVSLMIMAAILAPASGNDSSYVYFVVAIAGGSVVVGLLLALILLLFLVIAILRGQERLRTVTNAHGTGDSTEVNNSPMCGAHTAGSSDENMKASTSDHPPFSSPTTDLPMAENAACACGTGDSTETNGAHTAGPSDDEMEANPGHGVETQQPMEEMYYMNEGLGPSDPPPEYEYISTDSASDHLPLSFPSTDIPMAEIAECAHGTGDSTEIESNPAYGAHTAGPSDEEMEANPVYGVETQQPMEETYYMNEGLGPSDPPPEYEYIPADSADGHTPLSSPSTNIPVAENAACGMATQDH